MRETRPLSPTAIENLTACKRRLMVFIGELDRVRCEAYSIAHQYGLALQRNDEHDSFERINPLPERIGTVIEQVRDLPKVFEAPWP